MRCSLIKMDVGFGATDANGGPKPQMFNGRFTGMFYAGSRMEFEGWFLDVRIMAPNGRSLEVRASCGTDRKMAAVLA
jgi:acyl dehydratase